MDATRLLVGLDAQQRRAVVEPGQPLCILAGAGSGKTRVLTRRIAHRSSEGGADPRHVLALTFTRKAADEMASRLAVLGLRDRPTVGTFHAVAWWQLRTLWRDQMRWMPGLLTNKVHTLTSLPGRGRVGPGVLATEIEWARARLVPPDAYAEAAHRDDRRVGAPLEHIAHLYAAYEAAKRDRHVLDFDDILERCADALLSDPAFAAAQHWRFRHFFVDEFQDVNPLQHRLLEAWRGRRDDICVVGDPRQAIYRWNGADAGYLLDFAQQNPGATVIELTVNYRSTPQIVHAAAAAIEPRRVVQATASRPAGDTPTITAFATDADEARGVADAVRLAHGPGTRWDSQAVLLRTNAQVPLVEQAFARARIPYSVRGADPLLKRPEVRSALQQITATSGRPLAVAVDDLDTMVRELEDDPAPSAAERAESLSALLRFARELADIDRTAVVDDLRPWLAISVGADGSGTADAVSIVTFHAAKGLEWPIVHVLGLEDGLVPVSHARTPEAEAEERRLLHVALTRPSDVLRMSWAGQRSFRDEPVARRPSPYLAAIREAVATMRAVGSDEPEVALRRARESLATAEARSVDDDAALLGDLRAWRDRTARGAGVPGSVVMTDRTLAEVVRARPADRDALGRVRGIGPLVLDAYGADLLALLRDREAPRCASS